MIKWNWKLKLGMALVVISTLILALLLAIPLLHTTNKNKILLASTAIVVGEILFWTGGFLLGRQLFDKYKSHLDPKNWFNKNNKNDT